MKYAVEVTDEFSVELDLPPNVVGELKRVHLYFRVEGDKFPDALKQLGGANQFQLDPMVATQFRWSIPVTRDGEEVASAIVGLTLPDPDSVPPAKFPVVAEAMDRG